MSGTAKSPKKKITAPSTGDSYTLFPSRYGSHASMVEAAIVPKNEKLVVCKDEYGYYVTEKNNLDNRCADPWRFASEEWRKKTFEETEKVSP